MENSEISKIFMDILQKETTDIKVMEEGYTNKVYLVTCHDLKYILKVYTEYNSNEDKMVKYVGFPVVLYAGDKFRIEEYAEHQKFDFDRDYLLVAKELAKFHALRFTDLKNFSETTEEMFNRTKYPEIFRQVKNRIADKIKKLDCLQMATLERDTDINGDVEFFYPHTKPIPPNLTDMYYLSRECICHNDLQPGNILRINDKVKFLDYEYIGINNPMNDIANFFVEKMMDYNESVLKRENAFTEDQKIAFLQVYLNKQMVFKEILAINMRENYSHLFWAAWSFQFERDHPKFNYKKFRENRLTFLKDAKYLTDEEFNTLIK
jgi:thiamine kinase-like enzyme